MGFFHEYNRRLFTRNGSLKRGTVAEWSKALLKERENKLKLKNIQGSPPGLGNL